MPLDPISDLSTPVHLATGNANALFATDPPAGQAFPLNEDKTPLNTETTATKLTENVHKAIAFLKVSDASRKRYAPAGKVTFCNIYAYDLSYVMGSAIGRYYVPRVWWMPLAIVNIKKGIAQVPSYAKTVKEMQANDLRDWFETYGPNFGWKEESDLTALQASVNKTGDIGIIVGKKVGGNGHITVVIPENTIQKAVYDVVTKKVLHPLQSQAGVKNKEYITGVAGEKPWFEVGHDSKFYNFTG